MNAAINRACVITLALGVSVVAGSLASTGTAHATRHSQNKGQSTSHLVYCQKTGNHWTVTKGDDPSDNKNRIQVGTWNEHERGEGWNQKKAEGEYLSKCCPPTEHTTPKPPVKTPPKEKDCDHPVVTPPPVVVTPPTPPVTPPTPPTPTPTVPAAPATPVVAAVARPVVAPQPVTPAPTTGMPADTAGMSNDTTTVTP